MVEYRSRQRVYDVDDHGQPYRLRHAVGDVIDEAEARRQGLIPDPDGKQVPAPPADKARRTAGNKTRSTKEP